MKHGDSFESKRFVYRNEEQKESIKIRRDGMKSTSEESDDTSSKVHNISCDLNNIGI